VSSLARTSSTAEPRHRRRPVDAALLVAGLAVRAVSVAVAESEALPEVEVDLFRPLNDLPQALYPVVWPLMQYGTFITIPALTLVALAFRRFRLAAVLAVSGVGVYLLAKLVKEFVTRGRPGDLLSGVEMREVFEEGSLGFPSGHAAVAAALVVAASAYLPRVWTWIGVGLGVIVCLGRMYVGAHLPLDLVGGAALGVAVASAVHLALGVPRTASRT
jgi:membrane-associated phospholipid phosphatase